MIKVKQKIVNALGCFVARWIIHNCEDGLEIKRKAGASQLIKVFSTQAYRNVIKPAICRAQEGPLLVGDVVTDKGYWGEIVVTRIEQGRFGGYCRADGKPIDRLDAKEFSKVIGHVDVKVN